MNVWTRRANVARIAAVGAILGAMFILACSSRAARGAGLLVADGGLGGVLEVQEHSVRVTINNGVAVTEVTQIFHNTENRQVEALYTFPVPKDASVAGFSMWINGKEMVGEVVEKQRARQIYESYKPARKDPGLLEQTDYKTFEMRICPIAADARQKVQIRYYQELDLDNDWATYVYPLATKPRPGADSKVTGKFSFRLEAKSEVPIVKVESPSHGRGFVINKTGGSYFVASLETTKANLDKDIVLAYQASRARTGIDLITSRQEGQDGYFCLTLTAGKELEKPNAAMDYVFVLDVSGSMGDDGKLGLSRRSVAAFLKEMSPQDNFDLIAFNVSTQSLFNSLAPAGATNLAKADEFLASLGAAGGTELRPAVQKAYKYARPGRTLNVVVLSDGMTEQAERSALADMIKARPANSRVFCIGVGNEVNRSLLEQLAQETGGLASFISQSDNFDRQAKAFRRKLMHPAATDVKIEFEGAQVHDAVPARLPNLYYGSPLRLYGRYATPGDGKVTVLATVAGQQTRQVLNVKLPARDEGNPEIERMWAWRKVQGMLKEIAAGADQNQFTGEIVRLGEEYSIASPYTSFIVLENDAEYQRWKIDRRNALRIQRDRSANQEVLAKFEAIRDKAAKDIGPAVQADVTPSPASASPAPAPPPSNRGFDLRWPNAGGGPVGPVGVVLVSALGAATLWRKLRARKSGPR